MSSRATRSMSASALDLARRSAGSNDSLLTRRPSTSPSEGHLCNRPRQSSRTPRPRSCASAVSLTLRWAKRQCLHAERDWARVRPRQRALRQALRAFRLADDLESFVLAEVGKLMSTTQAHTVVSPTRKLVCGLQPRLQSLSIAPWRNNERRRSAWHSSKNSSHASAARRRSCGEKRRPLSASSARPRMLLSGSSSSMESGGKSSKQNGPSATPFAQSSKRPSVTERCCRASTKPLSAVTKPCAKRCSTCLKSATRPSRPRRQPTASTWLGSRNLKRPRSISRLPSQRGEQPTKSTSEWRRSAWPSFEASRRRRGIEIQFTRTSSSFSSRKRP
mmetsp:Transcript_17379/g.55373  ORF Transcript_17379/g.55373 Transcript_17379/m.55373 type:complete len:333 (-) Transcript_17379:1463-2461(-)